MIWSLLQINQGVIIREAPGLLSLLFAEGNRVSDLAGGIRQASDGVVCGDMRNVRLRFDCTAVRSQVWVSKDMLLTSSRAAERTLRVGVIGAGVMGSNPGRRLNRLSIVLVCVI